MLEFHSRSNHVFLQKLGILIYGEGEGNGNSLQYSCLGNPMDRGAWWATVHGGHKESDITEQLNLPYIYINAVLC